MFSTVPLNKMNFSVNPTYRFACAATRRFARLSNESLCQGTLRFGLPLTPPSSYVGELPFSHRRTLTDKSYVIHGIRSNLHYSIIVYCNSSAYHRDRKDCRACTHEINKILKTLYALY